MNVRHPTGVLHSFPAKNICYDKMDWISFSYDDNMKTFWKSASTNFNLIYFTNNKSPF